MIQSENDFTDSSTPKKKKMERCLSGQPAQKKKKLRKKKTKQREKEGDEPEQLEVVTSA